MKTKKPPTRIGGVHETTIDKAVDTVFRCLLDCSHPTLTREDIQGNAAVIVGKLKEAGVILTDETQEAV